MQNLNSPEMNASVSPVGARNAIGCPQKIEYSCSLFIFRQSRTVRNRTAFEGSHKSCKAITHHSSNTAAEQKFNNTHAPIRDFRCDGSKGDGWCQAGEVEEQDGRNHQSFLLSCICPIGQVNFASAQKIIPVCTYCGSVHGQKIVGRTNQSDAA